MNGNRSKSFANPNQNVVTNNNVNKINKNKDKLFKNIINKHKKMEKDKDLVNKTDNFIAQNKNIINK